MGAAWSARTVSHPLACPNPHKLSTRPNHACSLPLHPPSPHPSSPALAPPPQAFFLERLVVPAAQSYGLGPEYEYLRPSIKRFPMGPQQEAMARDAGFVSARHYGVGFGLMGVLVATKAGGSRGY